MYKDIDQFDYLIKTQADPLIDVDMLETRFLQSFDNLGLLEPTKREPEHELSAKDKIAAAKAEAARRNAENNQNASAKSVNRGEAR